MKQIEIDGRFYHYRRGKLVEIPQGWVGQITTERTKRKRIQERIAKRKDTAHLKWANRKASDIQ